MLALAHGGLGSLSGLREALLTLFALVGVGVLVWLALSVTLLTSRATAGRVKLALYVSVSALLCGIGLLTTALVREGRPVAVVMLLTVAATSAYVVAHTRRRAPGTSVDGAAVAEGRRSAQPDRSSGP